jgi:hypothetical protein
MKMDMTTTLTTALSGLQVGISNAQKAAGEVAKLTTGSESVQNTVRPLLELKQAEQEVATTSKVVAVENQTLGSLVDETA